MTVEAVDSRRAPSPRPRIMDIAPYIGGESAIKGAARVIKLASNENPLGPSPDAIAAHADAATRLHLYPDGGATLLRDAIARTHGLEADRIVCGAGSDELISLLCSAYAGPGDEVLYSEHGFLMYAISALGAGASPVAAPETNLCADVDALLGAVTARTRLLFLANPNNPTGSYLNGQQLTALRAGLPDDVLLVIDAAYAEYVSLNAYSAGEDLVRAGGNVVMTRTFSKIHGLAALRLGWAYCPPAVADVLNRVRGPFNVAGPAQAAGVAALADSRHAEKSRAHNDTWRAWTRGQVLDLGLGCPESVGNFLLIRFDVPARAIAADAHLKAAGIIVRRMAAYGLPESLRVSIGLEDDMRAFVDALAEFVR